MKFKELSVSVSDRSLLEGETSSRLLGQSPLRLEGVNGLLIRSCLVGVRSVDASWANSAEEAFCLCLPLGVCLTEVMSGLFSLSLALTLRDFLTGKLRVDCRVEAIVSLYKRKDTCSV